MKSPIREIIEFIGIVLGCIGALSVVFALLIATVRIAEWLLRW